MAHGSWGPWQQRLLGNSTARLLIGCCPWTLPSDKAREQKSLTESLTGVALPHPGCLPFLSSCFLLTDPSSGPQFPSQPGCLYGDQSSAPAATRSGLPLAWHQGLDDVMVFCTHRGGLPGSVPSSATCPPSSWAYHCTCLCLHFLTYKMGTQEQP